MAQEFLNDFRVLSIGIQDRPETYDGTSASRYATNSADSSVSLGRATGDLIGGAAPGSEQLTDCQMVCRYQLSYRDLEEMMRERGLTVQHTTVFR